MMWVWVQVLKKWEGEDTMMKRTTSVKTLFRGSALFLIILCLGTRSFWCQPSLFFRLHSCRRQCEHRLRACPTGTRFSKEQHFELVQFSVGALNGHLCDSWDPNVRLH